MPAPSLAELGALFPPDLADLFAAIRTDEGEVRHFRTYANYMDALSRTVSPHVEDPLAAVRQVAATQVYARLGSGRCREIGKVGQLMRSAWMTEVQMELSGLDMALTPMTSHWLPVQGYYTLYLLLRSWMIARNESPSGEHTVNIKCFSELVMRWPGLFPHPWNWLCHGDKSLGGFAFENLPAGFVPAEVSVQRDASDETSPHYICCFLRTTRTKKIEANGAEWKKHNGATRLPASQRRIIAGRLHKTSMLDALYRLRLRSNYENADSFMAASTETHLANGFHGNLRILVWSGCLMFENLIARAIGKEAYESELNRFLTSGAGELAGDLVAKRWAAISEL